MRWRTGGILGRIVRMKGARHAIRAKVNVWALCIALAMLHQVPGRILYRCRISGAFLDTCCCKVETTCCREEPSCCETDKKDSHENLPAERDAVAADSCGCCDLVYQEGTTPFVRRNEQHRPATRERSALLCTLPSAPNVSIAHVAVGSVISRHPPPRKAPLYLLYSSLLF